MSDVGPAGADGPGVRLARWATSEQSSIGERLTMSDVLTLAVDLAYWQETSIKLAIILAIVPTTSLIVVYVFLFKMMAHMQSRLGPMDTRPPTAPSSSSPRPSSSSRRRTSAPTVPTSRSSCWPR